MDRLGLVRCLKPIEIGCRILFARTMLPFMHRLMACEKMQSVGESSSCGSHDCESCVILDRRDMSVGDTSAHVKSDV